MLMAAWALYWAIFFADAFVVRGPSSGGPSSGGPDVVAGYPWFGAWARDTMISYEGLFLATARAAEGRELLRAYAPVAPERAGRRSPGEWCFLLLPTAHANRPPYCRLD